MSPMGEIGFLVGSEVRMGLLSYGNVVQALVNMSPPLHDAKYP